MLNIFSGGCPGNPSSSATDIWGSVFFFNCNIILLSQLKPKDMNLYLLLLVVIIVLFVHQAAGTEWLIKIKSRTAVSVLLEGLKVYVLHDDK